MKRSTLILSALMALTMAGCREVPEDVRSRAEEQQGATAPQTGAQTDTGSGGAGKPSPVVREKIGNIGFACDPDPIETDEFYILKSELQIENTNEANYGLYKDRLRKTAKELFGFDISDDEITTELHDTYDPETEEPTGKKYNAEFSYYNDNDVARVSEGDNYFLFGTDRKANGNPYDFGERTVYTPDNYPDTVYDMNDGSQMTISQAIEQGDGIIKKLHENELFGEDLTVELFRIAVHETDDDNIIRLWYRTKRSGLYINYDGYIGPSLTDTYMSRSYLEIQFIGDDSALQISNLSSGIIIDKEKVDKVMSYDDAKKRLATGLANNMTYTVTESGLRYCCLFTQFQKQNIYRPMWCFVLNDPTDERNTITENSGSEPYPRVTAFVDAINGNLYYCNPLTEVFSISPS